MLAGLVGLVEPAPDVGHALAGVGDGGLLLSSAPESAAVSLAVFVAGHAQASDGQHQFIAWGDNRDIVKDFLWPNGRNDPDVFFAKQ